MTAMERFKNELKEHLGQEKLVLQPRLYRHLRVIYDLQHHIYTDMEPIDGGINPQSSYLIPFVESIFYFIEPLREFLVKGSQLNSADKVCNNISKVVDGAYFINFMNVANQLYLYENYYLSNLPKVIWIEFLYQVTKAEDILNNYGKELTWAERHSSYDHTLSTFDFEDSKGTSGKLPTIEILDKPVSRY